MNAASPRIEPIYVIFCDDIRREFNGKEILIGIYSGDIVVPQTPSPMVLGVWIPFRRIGTGTVPIEYRMLDGGTNRVLGYGTTNLTLNDSTEVGSFNLPGLSMIFTQPTTLEFQLKQYDEPWNTIGSIPVRVGPIPIHAAPSATAPPSSPPPNAAEEISSAPAPSPPVRPTRRRRS